MQVDRSTPVTLTTRVVRQIIAEVKSGTYNASDRLPSEREYAVRLRVSRNTVTAAYAELEQLGVIRRLHGKGAFLCALPVNNDSFSWSGKVSTRANSLDEPVLEMLARRCAGDMQYPLSAGTPSLEIFPKDTYAETIARVVQERVPQVLAVAPTEGQWQLREEIARWTGTEPHYVMITAGAQEGIDLLARCLIEPGDHAIVESPTYPGAIQSLQSAGARLAPWSTKWQLDELENLLLRFRPKLIFTTPSFQNPTGRVMDFTTRQGLLALAKRYRVPVIEDDVYSQTWFKSAPPPSLYKLDIHSQVIALSTFSKMLAPGLRIGWLLAPKYMVKQLALIKMRSNLFTGGLNQLVLSHMLRSGAMEQHLLRLRTHHATLCAAAVQALQPLADDGLLRFEVPTGSLYVWCTLVGPLEMETFLAGLEQQGVSVAPGLAFLPGQAQRYDCSFRICFTAVGTASLHRGLAVLAARVRSAVSESTGQHARNSAATGG